jgi:catechol 2,3-dioxygenase-like lactoylglutathione lyase family enzyme
MSDHSLTRYVLGVVTMLAVRDLEKSVAFYRDNLGFEVQEQSAHIAGLTKGSMNLDLFTETPPGQDIPTIALENLNKPGHTSVIIDILVDDCHAAYETLLAEGVNFLTPPHKPSWGGWRCFATDPDGYLIELEENKNSPYIQLSAHLTH